jgi:hypothetical protein
MCCDPTDEVMSPSVVVRRVAFTLCAVLLPAVVSGQTTATVSNNAPIYIRAEVTPTPLRVAEPGTRLRVLRVSDEWLQVEFGDQQFGRRVGWLQRGLVALDGESALTAVAPSVDAVPPAAAHAIGEAQPRGRASDLPAPFPRHETGLGWSMLQVSYPTIELKSTLGWNVSTVTNLSPWVGIVGDFGGHYKTAALGSELDAMKHSVMSGPRFAFRNSPVVVLYGQFLVGLVRFDANDLGGHLSSNDFAIQPGGGIDVGNKNVASRFEVGWRRVYGDVSAINEFRLVIGVVFRSGP